MFRASWVEIGELQEKIEEIKNQDKILDNHIDSTIEIINSNSDKVDFSLLNEINQELRLAEEAIDKITVIIINF